MSDNGNRSAPGKQADADMSLGLALAAGRVSKLCDVMRLLLEHLDEGKSLPRTPKERQRLDYSMAVAYKLLRGCE